MIACVPFLTTHPRTVWHTLADDGSALDRATMRRWNILMRVFTAEYLHLKPELPSSVDGRGEIRDELVSTNDYILQRRGSRLLIVICQ